MTVGLLLVTAAALWAFPQLWTMTVERVDRHRVHALDGARGLLTIWVLSNHLMLGQQIDARGVWHVPPGALGALLASGFFVAPFFMLTAMLFGGRLVATRGRMTALPFYLTRAFRLAPAYFVAVALLVLGAFVASGFLLYTPVLMLAKQIIRWAMFDFVARYEINGVDLLSHYGVLWTLRYEILFYLILPLLAFIHRRLSAPLAPMIVTFVIGCLSWPFLFFAAGILASLCTFRLAGPRARIGWQVGAVAGIAVIVVAAMHGIVYHMLHAAMLVPALVCLALELPLVRVFRMRSLRVIGEISYSNYVLHGAILYLLVLTVVDLPAIMALPFFARIGCLVAIGTVAIAGALACFVFVEQPCIRRAAVLAERLKRRLRPPAPLAAESAVA